MHQVLNKFALSSYHSWIFRATKWENIKLNYACMKRWKSAARRRSFFPLSVPATWSPQQPVPSFPLLIRGPTASRLEHPCGCRHTAVHSATRQITVFLGEDCGRAETSKAAQTQTAWWSGLCRWCSQHKLRDKTRSALRDCTWRWKDFPRVPIRRCCRRTVALP